MSNVYYHPTEIDGEPRRAIVERVEACRPEGAMPDAGCSVHHPYSSVNLRLTRLAVIEWLQSQAVRNAASFLPDGKLHWAFRRGEYLSNGASDTDYNELAHRLADALNIAH